MKITEALLAEHLVFHNLFDHLETTVPRLRTLPEIKAMAALLETMLRAHSDTEDALFLGPLEHCFEQIGQRNALIHEHHEIDDNLRRVRHITRVKVAQELLLSAVAHSRRHFDREERIVFPMAERVLKSRTLTELGESWLDRRTRVTIPEAQTA